MQIFFCSICLQVPVKALIETITSHNYRINIPSQYVYMHRILPLLLDIGHVNSILHLDITNLDLC